jgi:hypothetical protein
MKLLLFFLLSFAISRAAEPRIVFENRPEFGIPREAEQQAKVDPNSHGTLTQVLGDTLQTVTVRYFSNVWTDQKQVSDYLVGLLVDQRTATFTFQIWSQGVGVPDIECILTFKNHRQGKLLVWDTTACVLDDTGKWWFVSVFDYYHQKHPKESKSPAHKTPQEK